MQFEEFPKIGRLKRDMVITEKIDGTNAQVFITELADDAVMPTDTPIVAVVGRLLIYAGSRNRYLLPNPGRAVAGKVFNDNFGFAQWVKQHAVELATLGPGRHFGEWWGSGIQRGYGLTNGEKRFSLFNVNRWQSGIGLPACCGVVPVLTRHTFDTNVINDTLAQLARDGSVASPGFMKPEGIVVFQNATRTLFKVTLDNDAQPKGAQ